jgi:integrase
MTKVSAPYLYRKRGIYYLQKRIPKPLIPKYGRSILQRSLRTTNRADAVRLSSSIVASLEREWQALLFDIPDTAVSAFDHLTSGRKHEPLLTEAMKVYLEDGVKSADIRLCRATETVIKSVIDLAGDKTLTSYTRNDALQFRDALVAKGVAQATVKRHFSRVRAIWNFSAREHGIMTANPFANMNLGGGKAPKKRHPIPTKDIRTIQKLCKEIDDDMRWIIATLSDSGMRLAEVIGLHKNDLHLDAEIPFVRLSEHPWRRLKTLASRRDVPLVGASLWGLKRALTEAEGPLLFPRYCSIDRNKANYASNSLNKWLKAYVPNGCVIHSFRHSFRDRLRAVQCPSDMIDQIGGWSNAGVGQAYGEGYSIKVLHKWLCKAC